jgi:hypothetical protein
MIIISKYLRLQIYSYLPVKLHAMLISKLSKQERESLVDSGLLRNKNTTFKLHLNKISVAMFKEEL